MKLMLETSLKLTGGKGFPSPAQCFSQSETGREWIGGGSVVWKILKKGTEA